MEKLLGVDRAQVRRAMMTKTDLMRLVDANLTPPGVPQSQTCAAGNMTMMMMIMIAPSTLLARYYCNLFIIPET